MDGISSCICFYLFHHPFNGFYLSGDVLVAGREQRAVFQTQLQRLHKNEEHVVFSRDMLQI